MPVNYGSLPFLEALAFFRAKLNLPTQKWDDLLGAAHDRAFVVAGAMKADLLADLKAAIDQAMADGTTIETFRKDFKRIVAERGWTGWTGEGTQAGEAWRTRVIYETNLFSSYSAGRYQQMKEIADLRPYWRYRHSPASTVPRAEHLAWDGLILKHDDPFWAAHTPPNGFGCKCFIETLAERDLKKKNLTVTPKGQIPYAGTAPKTGLPQGVDKGWDYPPGRTWWPTFDKHDYATAKAIVEDYAQDGVMSRWFERLALQFSEWKKDPRFAGLKGEPLITAIRKARLIPDEKLPMAVIKPDVQALLNTDRKVLFVSADTMVKQLEKRAKQNHAADWYETLQGMLDSSPVVTPEGDQKVIYWRRNERLWVAVVKTTKARDEVYLVSLHQTNPKDIKAKVPASEWSKLGVA